jgi:hypothetical protein
LTVVTNPVRPEIETREPEDAGLLQFGKRLRDPLFGDSDVQVAGTGESKRAR